MTPKLSILIPTLPARVKFLNRLVDELVKQCGDDDQYLINFIADDDTTMDIGTKRNKLMAEVKTEYMAFFDDDDMPGPNYIKHLMEGIGKGVDCCSLTGIITTDGKDPRKFIHSIQYTEMFERDNVYYRPVMHINCVKTELGRQAVFPAWARSEDSNWAFQLAHKGVLKTEHYIDEPIYNYLYVSDKRY